MNIEKNKTYIWTQEVPEGTMKTTFTVKEDNTNPFRLKGPSEPHYMCEILKVTVDEEDKTEKYIEKAFDGETRRGIPDHKLEDMDLEEVEEK